MTIASALSNAASGLTANARRLSVASDNIANALTKGYAKREVMLATRPGSSGGVRVIGVQSSADPALTAMRRIADGDAAARALEAQGTKRLAQAIGELGGEGGIFERETAFERALLDLAETPENVVRQRSAATAAKDLADAFNSASAIAGEVRSKADADIASMIDEINVGLRQISDLNLKISRMNSLQGDPSALIQEQNRLIDGVALSLPIRVDVRDDGSVLVRTEGGLTLVDRTAREISFNPTPIVTPEMSYDSGSLSGLTISGVDITPGGGGTQQVAGGALAAAFDLRDSKVPAFQAGLDALAAELAMRLDDPAVDLSRAPGDPGIFLAQGSKITTGYSPGLSGDLRLNPVIDPLSGDPSLLRDGLGTTAVGPEASDMLPRAFLEALRSSQTLPVLGANSPRAFEQRISLNSEQASTLRVDAAKRSAEAETTRSSLAAVESGRLGVDTDAELQKLLALENAYAANARVIDVAQRMLDEITQAAR